MSSGLLCHVVFWVATDVSEGIIASMYSGPPRKEFILFHENHHFVKNSLCEFGKYMLKA
jgi:hypothetical protein